MRPSQPAPDGLQGRCLAGRYRLIEMIGSGGAGNVWAAVDEVLQRRVAVKDVGAPPWLSVESWEALRERTLREARAAAAIGHPNVVTVYDVIEEDGRPWIVMQLVEARTLAQVVEAEGPCPPRRIAEIGLQVLAALQAAHAHGILHRDVKPSNVLVCDDGRAVLTDFGIATVDGDVALTASGVLVGAPAYIAPERVQGGTAGPASDLWSLGATLYTAVEGRPPYRRDSPISTIAAVVHEDPDPTSKAGVLTPLLLALLARDPEQRPSVAQVEGFLRAIVSSAPGPDAELSAELATADVGPQQTRPVPLIAAPALAGTAAAGTAAAGTAAAAGGEVAAAASAGAAADPTADLTADTTALAATTDTGPRSTSRPAAASSHQPQQRLLALVTAAATAMLAIMLLGYLARQSAEPASPSQQPASEESAGQEPVLDLQVHSTQPAPGTVAPAPVVAGNPASTSTSAAAPQPTSVTTTAAPSTTSQPPEPTTVVSSTPPPSPTTTVEQPTTTATGPGSTEEAASRPQLP